MSFAGRLVRRPRLCAGRWLVLGAAALLVAGLSVLAPATTASATGFVEAAKLTASDGAGNWRLGYSVAVSSDGSTVVVGAWGATVGNNNEEGAVYVFNKSGTETAKLTASNASAFEELGWSVGVSSDGSTVVAGAPGAYPDSTNPNASPTQHGAAYVFTRPAGGWISRTETAELTASDGTAFDELGSAVGVSSDGSTVVAGAPGVTVGGHTGQGAAYVFTKPAGGWASGTQTANLIDLVGGIGEQFGYAVGVSSDGSTVVAGGPSATVGGHTGQGAAYVFTKPAGGWASGTETAKLTASDGTTGGEFGGSVGVSSDGSTVAVVSGGVYVFTKPAGGWASGTETAKLTASEDVSSVVASSDGSTVVAGAHASNSLQGAVYVFTKPTGRWASVNPTAKLTAPDGAANDQFGFSVGVSSDGLTVVAGAPGATVGGDSSRGAAYVFTQAGATAPSAPSITSQPASLTVNAGQTASFSAAASGSPAPTVQWQVYGNVWTDIAGATSTTLSITNTALSDNGNQYRAVFTNTGGSAATNAATLTVNPASTTPAVTSQPASQTVNVGQTATFTAAASGDPTPTVQWQVYRNGWTDIAGATSTTLSITNAALSDKGNQYRAVFTNTNGSAITLLAILTVNAAGAPLITSQPASQTVNAGQTATFRAAASGDPTPTMQWFFSTCAGCAPQEVVGATATSLFINNTTLSDNGSVYWAVFTNTNGLVTTNGALLTVNAAGAPLITSQPADQTVNAGQTATFTAAASGNPIPTVQWQVSTNGTSWTDIAGATSTTLSITNTPLSDNGNQYRAVFTNAGGSVNTNPATLTVNSAATAPAITFHPADQTVTAGLTASFSAAASGSPTPTVQWQVSNNGTSWADIAGATSATLSITNTPLSDNGNQYRAVFTNAGGSVATNPATLTVNSAATAPAVISHPSNQTVTAGQTATFTAAASGSPTPTVQWQVANGATWVAVTGATSTTLSITNTPASDNGNQYRAVFTNTAGSVGTNAATLTVNSTPAITSAASTTFTAGSLGTFTVTATGGPTPSLSAGTLPSGVTFVDNGNSTATLSGTLGAGTGGTYVLSINAHNGIGSDAIQAFTLTVHAAPAFTSASATTFIVGSIGSFTVGTTGNPFATVSKSGTLPAGVDFTPNNNGKATLTGTPQSGTAGTYPITLTATNGVGSPAVQQFTLTVQKISQTTTFSSAAPTNAVFNGLTYAVLASASSPLTVSFSSEAPLVCQVSGNMVSFVGVGTCVIDANQAGNADYQPAPQVQQSFSVARASQTITFNSLPTVTYGVAPFTPSATASSRLPVSFATTTPAVCTSSGTNGGTITVVAIGTCKVEASQAGNTNYYGATPVDQSFTVNPAPATVTPIDADANPFQVSSPGGTATLTLSGAISATQGDIGTAHPVTYTLTPIGPGSAYICTDTATSGVSGQTLSSSCSFSSVAVNVYQLTITAGGNYTGSGTAVVTVFDPSLGYTTGGGTIMHNGTRAAFGFNTKYLKSGQIQGSLGYIEHQATGDVIMKANAMGSLSVVNGTTGTAKIGYLQGKATLNGVGNYTFLATAVDSDSTGPSANPDQFGLQVKDPSGKTVAAFTFSPINLSGGNIIIPQK